MNVDQEVRWTPEVGALLQQARGSMSKRSAAAKAGFSEATWRALELGVRRPAKGVEVPVNPTPAILEAAAIAVGLHPSQVFELVGLTYNGNGGGQAVTIDDRVTAIEGRLDRIDETLGRVLDHLDPGREGR